MDKKRKIIIGIVVATIVTATGITTFIWKKGSQKETVEQITYVNSIESIMNMGSSTLIRFAGVVETQEKKDIQLNSEKTIEKVNVNEGDTVSVGTVLFSYSTQEDEEKISKAQLDLERIVNAIQNKSNEIEILENEKQSVSGEDQLDYTMQIQSANMELKQSEYEKKTKETEIQKLQESIENAEVRSDMDGIVKSIKSDQDNEQINGDAAQAFMTIMSMGNFRVKGRVNEQNIGSVTPGQKVIVHSRIDESKTWTGEMGEVDRKKPENANSNLYGGDAMTQSSSYPFYIRMDSSEGLMLGQHVYIEPDFGQQAGKEGIWLDEFFIVDAQEEHPYVWADNGKSRLEKREVVLGDHDQNTMQYQIKDGLKNSDLIAYPEENMKEGGKTVVGEY